MPLYLPILDNPISQNRLHISQFIDLLKEEEKYYKEGAVNTKLMITRLRKIFYDAYGWNTQLIRGAAHIKGRYKVTLTDDPSESYIKQSSLKPELSVSESGVKHQHRVVTVRPDDWLNPNAGSVPEIYKNNNQEVLLENGLICDMGHVLAGMDAYNYPSIVSPLPNWLFFIHKLFPNVDSNLDASTWIGDLSSISGEFLFEEKLAKKRISETQKQELINFCSSPADNLGNIDSYVISKSYDISSANGQKVTEIFEDYYLNNGIGAQDKSLPERILIYCESIGLKNWDGNKFENEKKWLTYYVKELRTTTAFYVFTRYGGLKKWFIALKTWLGVNDEYLALETILVLYLDALRGIINQELVANSQVS